MNKHGQVLVTFVIMVPLILLLISILIELSVISYNKHHLNSLSKTIIASCIDNPDKNDIINLYNKNGINDDIDISIDSGIRVSFNHEIEGFLGKKYDIKIDIVGKKSGEKIIYTKGSKNE